MKKTLIALAVAALPVAAVADVTLFGDIKGGVEYSKVSGVDNTITNINDFDSSFGIKGHEHLGNGISTIWQVQQTVSLDSKSKDNDRFGNKETFIGLETPYGTLRAGNVSNQFNSDMDTLNKWTASDGSTAKLGSTFGRTSRRHTAVRYDTPVIAGFSGNVLYAPSDNKRYDQARQGGNATGKAVDPNGDILNDDVLNNLCDNATYGLTTVVAGGVACAAPNLNTVTDHKSAIAVGLNYANAGFFVKYGYEREDNKTGAGTGVYQAHRIEGGYDANNLFVGLGYQFTKDEWGDGSKSQEAALTVAYTFGNITPKLSYATGWKDYDYSQVIVGVDYALSKRTTASLAGAYYKQKEAGVGGADAKITTVNVGLRHLF